MHQATRQQRPPLPPPLPGVQQEEPPLAWIITGVVILVREVVAAYRRAAARADKRRESEAGRLFQLLREDRKLVLELMRMMLETHPEDARASRIRQMLDDAKEPGGLAARSAEFANKGIR